jgi:hypothetical protein
MSMKSIETEPATTAHGRADLAAGVGRARGVLVVLCVAGPGMD